MVFTTVWLHLFKGGKESILSEKKRKVKNKKMRM
jgi:hypothetical protein